MKDPSKAKVMYEVLGTPMLHYVIDLAYALQAQRVIVIVGYQREAVSAYVHQSHPDAECIVQAEQLGTGHAVRQAEDALKSFAGDVLILSGDVPLLTKESTEEFLYHHRETGAIASVLTAEFADPTGYGRVVRNNDGSVEKIVEQKDATEAERAIREINSGVYVFHRPELFEALAHVKNNNVQREYYLPDVLGYFRQRGLRVSALPASHPDEIRGVNTLDQLNEVADALRNRSAPRSAR